MGGHILIHIILFLAYAGLFLWLIFRWRFFDIPTTKRSHFAFFFLLKVLAGIALTLIYTYYYTDKDKADIWRYFKDSKVISSLLFTHPQAWWHIITDIDMERADVYQYLLPTQHFSHSSADLATSNSFLIRVISLLNYFSYSSIFINTLFFDFLSFIGLVWLYKALRNFFEDFSQLLYVPLFLLPSVIFWGSGLLKEAILLFAIGLYISSFWNWQQGRSKWNILWVLLGLLMVCWLKLYIAAILVLCSVSIAIRIPLWQRMTMATMLILLGWLGMGHTLCERIIDKRNEFIELANREQAGSTTDTQILETDCNSLFSTVPTGLVNAMLRPFVWEGGKVFHLLFAVENVLILLILLFLLARYFKLPTGYKRWIAVFCLSFALLNYSVIGLSIPVMGAIVHYRIIPMLFMAVGGTCFIDLAKIRFKL